MVDGARDLARIEAALRAAAEIARDWRGRDLRVEYKQGDDPVTVVDREIDAVLREALVRENEGWLSEESVDRPGRLACERVWVVDSLDGTREFIAGVPEWAISIGLVERGRAVAGGVCNPAAEVTVLGSIDTGVFVNGRLAPRRPAPDAARPVILASRSELRKGRWRVFDELGIRPRPTGSVAYKLALVAAGKADATWTMDPRHEWDVAGGVALVLSAGGFACARDGGPLEFNRPEPRLAGVFAATAEAAPWLRPLVGPVLGWRK